MRKYLLLVAFAFAADASAQTGNELSDSGNYAHVADGVPLPVPITVVASGIEQPLDQTGRAVSILSRTTIEQVQGVDLTRALERLPGVTLSRNGGLGGFTGLRIRGADAEQTLVLVDGVKVADVAAPGSGFDFGNLLAGEVERIELLRGSNSVVWGSEAIGGVVAVTTRAVDGVAVGAEYGANDTSSGELAVGTRGETFSGTLGGGYVRSDGVSAAAIGNEPDGYRQWRLGGKVRTQFGNFALVGNARWLDSRLEIDGFPAPAFVFADTPEYQKTREASGRVGAEATLGGLVLQGGYALSDTRRSYYDPAFGNDPSYRTFGRSERADLTGRVGGTVTLDFGADTERTRFRSTFDSRKTARLSSVHALIGWHPGGADLAAGARYDDHSRFGGEWTFGANGNVELARGWRARASYGEGFKAPTLFQLFSDFGNRALGPERSRSLDAGVQYGAASAPLRFAATVFRRDSRDLIDFVSCFGVTGGICAGRPFGTYDNIRRARAEGVELEAEARPTDTLMVSAAYAFVKATNRATGADLARRPRHALTLAADWGSPLGGLRLGGDLRLVSDSFDDAGNFTRIDGHALVALRASVPLGERFELYGRVENLADVRYETATGYGTLGRSAYAGVRARF